MGRVIAPNLCMTPSSVCWNQQNDPTLADSNVGQEIALRCSKNEFAICIQL